MNEELKVKLDQWTMRKGLSVGGHGKSEGRDPEKTGTLGDLKSFLS